MKRLFLFLLVLLHVSCFAQKAENDVINDFLEVELSKMVHDSIYLIEMPLHKSEGLKLYEKSLNERSANKNYKETWVIPEITNWPINQEEIDLLKKSIEKGDKNWSLNDFKYKRFIILPEKTVRSRDFIVSNISANKYVFNLSRPVLNKQKDFAIFQFYPSFLIGGSSSDLGGVIIMEKKDDKWIQIAVIQPAVYN